MQKTLDKVYQLKITPSYLTTYSYRVNNNGNVVRPQKCLENLKMNEHKGNLSNKAQKKLSNCIEYFLLLCNQNLRSAHYAGKDYMYKLAFVTLTLSSPQIHSDQQIKKCLLHQFFLELNQRFSVRNYIWRAEKQSNGRVHFHILIDKFCPHTEIRNIWNRIQNKLGYIDRYREIQIDWHSNGFRPRFELLKKWSLKNQYKAYKSGIKFDWRSPNSTDIHSIKYVNNLAAYIIKYQTKNEKDKPLVEGRLWGSSEGLSKLNGVTLDIDSFVSDSINEICTKFPTRVHVHDYFCYINVRYIELFCLPTNVILLTFYQYILSIKNSS